MGKKKIVEAGEERREHESGSKSQSRI